MAFNDFIVLSVAFSFLYPLSWIKCIHSVHLILITWGDRWRSRYMIPSDPFVAGVHFRECGQREILCFLMLIVLLKNICVPDFRNISFSGGWGGSCSHGIWKFPGQGSNLSHSCDLCHSCSNTGSLTHWAQGLNLCLCRDNTGSLTVPHWELPGILL